MNREWTRVCIVGLWVAVLAMWAMLLYLMGAVERLQDNIDDLRRPRPPHYERVR